MTPQYKVGDRVYYVNGQFGEQEATVTRVATEAIPGVPYSEPVYLIKWKPTGFAAAHESDLSATPREPSEVS